MNLWVDYNKYPVGSKVISIAEFSQTNGLEGHVVRHGRYSDFGHHFEKYINTAAFLVEFVIPEGKTRMWFSAKHLERIQ